MDTLALLCTLHADGPASLQRLRAAELSSIDDVLGCSVETTADILGLSMAQARRFHREARMLAMRMHTEGLDREERMYPGAEAMEAPPMQSAGQVEAPTQPVLLASTSETSTVAEPEPRGEGADELREKPNMAAILAPVIERWEEEDSKAAVEAEEPSMPPQSANATGTQLTPDVLDGVDQPLRDALRAAGYGTLTALAEVEPLELSRTTGRTYSEACRVRFLARRALDEGAQGMADSPQEEPSASPACTEPEEPMDTKSDTLAAAVRALRELSGRLDSVSDRFSPAHPESQLSQDFVADESEEEEGPGGPFA